MQRRTRRQPRHRQVREQRVVRFVVRHGGGLLALLVGVVAADGVVESMMGSKW
ncbi:hypothetical protein GCM10025868_07990 [Angustibacter aerolatus]|uniref:Uncharacterized protein n=1 Tax=Angustibacter aerolatus TaxID=1162965 RepID=A0ABQ6JEI3_9ACTN|nr:hypothetical protein [Angustibacter aerolatus]GMA85549.1 hypothetical protein GCM10025868_07990 [Angustibacter aerolatus]